VYNVRRHIVDCFSVNSYIYLKNAAKYRRLCRPTIRWFRIGLRLVEYRNWRQVPGACPMFRGPIQQLQSARVEHDGQ